MLTKPDLDDEEITQFLYDIYELDIDEILFLPLGADSNTAVYRVTARDETAYFLKLRNENFSEASVMVPHYLNQIGLRNVIPPLATKTNQLWANLNTFKVALYPYIDGFNAAELKLSEHQWIQFGKMVKQLHTAAIPKYIKNVLPTETFSSKWCHMVASFLKRVQNEEFEDHIATQAALFLRSKQDLIFSLIQRIKELRSILKSQSFEYIVCHADIHGWNVFIDKSNRLHLIDWDTLILSPKERDLMFIGSGIWDSGCPPLEESSRFYKGYGETSINQDAICYYRLERIIEDIGIYCERIFSSNESLSDRKQALNYIQANFLPNGTIERACAQDNLRNTL